MFYRPTDTGDCFTHNRLPYHNNTKQKEKFAGLGAGQGTGGSCDRVLGAARPLIPRPYYVLHYLFSGGPASVPHARAQNGSVYPTPFLTAPPNYAPFPGTGRGFGALLVAPRWSGETVGGLLARGRQNSPPPTTIRGTAAYTRPRLGCLRAARVQ